MVKKLFINKKMSTIFKTPVELALLVAADYKTYLKVIKAINPKIIPTTWKRFLSNELEKWILETDGTSTNIYSCMGDIIFNEIMVNGGPKSICHLHLGKGLE